jgi:hypothetical protein
MSLTLSAAASLHTLPLGLLVALVLLGLGTVVVGWRVVW